MLFMERDEICAHGHLHSHNIFVNLRDMQVLIGDYGLYSLKKFCKIFQEYNMANNSSAPEVWETQDKSVTFFNRPEVDIYSLGFILWELETGLQPFANETKEDVRVLLLDKKVRPRIPSSTNQNLALLIRRCW